MTAGGSTRRGSGRGRDAVAWACSGCASAWAWWAGACSSSRATARGRRSGPASPCLGLRGGWIMTAKLRVLLADDHNVVRAGLRALIDAQPDMEVVGEAADGEAACRLATE